MRTGRADRIDILRCLDPSAHRDRGPDSASARPHSPSGSRHGSTRRSCSTRSDNPFLARRPGRPTGRRLPGAAVLPAHAAPAAVDAASRPTCSRQATVCDYLFDKDKIYAYLNLDDNELFIYQRLYELLARDMPAPDLVDLPAGADRRAPAPPARTRRATPEPTASSPTRYCAS